MSGGASGGRPRAAARRSALAHEQPRAGHIAAGYTRIEITVVVVIVGILVAVGAPTLTGLLSQARQAAATVAAADAAERLSIGLAGGLAPALALRSVTRSLELAGYPDAIVIRASEPRRFCVEVPEGGGVSRSGPGCPTTGWVSHDARRRTE